MDPKKLREIFRKQTDKNISRTVVRNDNGGMKHEPINFLKRNRNSFMQKKKPKRFEKKNEEFKDLNRVDFSSTSSGTKRKFVETNEAKKHWEEKVEPKVKKKKIHDQLSVKTNSSLDQLKGSQFRFLNELLYTQSSEEASQMFENDPEAFQIYHTGFETQRLQWPKDPLQRVIKFIQRLPKQSVVADFGCGDARLAMSLSNNKVHSFDFMALNERVTACDMRKTPLKSQTVDVAVFCLSLMGTNCNEFIKEANRVLKTNGVLKIVELTSRIQRLTRIVNQIEKMGFTCIDKAPANFFIYLTFTKSSQCPKGDLPLIVFNPCTYKKR